MKQYQVFVRLPDPLHPLAPCPWVLTRTFKIASKAMKAMASARRQGFDATTTPGAKPWTPLNETCVSTAAPA